MKLRLVSPQPPSPAAPARSAPRLTGLAGVHIGLLANSKRNGDRLLEAVAARLAAEHGAIIGPMITKAHASLPAATDVLNTFEREVALVLTAIGD